MYLLSDLIILLQGIFENLAWNDLFKFLIGGASGGAIYKIAQIYFTQQNTDREFEVDLRDELREEISVLRERFDSAEKEIQTWRQKHFELQERYHEIKRENQELKEELKQLREENQELFRKLKKYRN